MHRAPVICPEMLPTALARDVFTAVKTCVFSPAGNVQVGALLGVEDGGDGDTEV